VAACHEDSGSPTWASPLPRPLGPCWVRTAPDSPGSRWARAVTSGEANPRSSCLYASGLGRSGRAEQGSNPSAQQLPRACGLANKAGGHCGPASPCTSGGSTAVRCARRSCSPAVLLRARSIGPGGSATVNSGHPEPAASWAGGRQPRLARRPGRAFQARGPATGLVGQNAVHGRRRRS
jgi:hypothetical protein